MANIDYREVGITEPEQDVWEFEVVPEHIEEIRHQYISWEHNDDPEVIPKGDVNIRCTPAAAVALQIFIMCGSFKPGLYRAAKYSQDWHRYRPKVVKKEKDVEVTDDYAF